MRKGGRWGGGGGSTKAPEGWRGGECGGDGRTTMPCSSIGLSDHVRSRGKTWAKPDGFKSRGLDSGSLSLSL